jgi:hypothetical protein
VKRALVAAAAAVAAVVAGLLIADDEGEPGASRPQPPVARVTSADGGFRRAANPEGMPLFTARNLTPGDSADGSVRVANRGSRRGYFYLTQTELTDLPGDGGGALSPVLRLTVRDVTVARRPRTVYEGAFGGMDARALGFFAPGQTRSYSFTARLPERGVQPELYVESAVRARFVWSPLGDAPRRDRRPPRVELAIDPVQRIIERGYLEAEARCAEQCRLTTEGTVDVGPGPARPAPAIRDRSADRGDPAVLRVRIPPDDLRELPATLLAGEEATIRVTIRARDLAGNLASVRRTIRLKPRR